MPIPSYVYRSGYPLSERAERAQESFAHLIARHLPSRIRYWSVIVAAVRAEPNLNPGNMTAVAMLDAERRRAPVA